MKSLQKMKFASKIKFHLLP